MPEATIKIPPIDRLATSTEIVAQNWDEYRPSVHGSAPYEAVTTRLIDAARTRLDPPLPEPLASSAGILHGARVIGYYAEIAAAIAKTQKGWTPDSLCNILNTDQSFRSLAAIASEPNGIAKHIENRLGLIPYSHFPDDPTLHSSYSLTKEGFAAKDIGSLILFERIRQGLSTQASNPQSERCPAHRTQNLRKIYSAVLHICALDPELFQRTLKST